MLLKTFLERYQGEKISIEPITKEVTLKLILSVILLIAVCHTYYSTKLRHITLMVPLRPI